MLIGISNRLGIYNSMRDFYNMTRIDNFQRRKFLAQFVSPGSMCFDIGANIGEKIDLFRSMGARVVAFEPQKECAFYLKKKFRYDDQVTIVEKAISSQEGICEMFCCEANQLSTLSLDWMKALQDSQRFGKVSWDKKTLVSTTTLELMIKEHGNPDFLKIDVEGNEYEVLKNLTSRVPYICFEYAFPESRKSLELCLKHLDGLGYSEYNLSCDDKKFIFLEWSLSQGLIEFLKKEFKNYSCGNVYVKYSGDR